MKRPSFARIAAVGVVLLMLGAVISFAVGPSPTEPNPDDVAKASEVRVPTEGVDERFARPEGYTLSGNGVVEPRDREVAVAAAVPGRVEAVPVVEGQRVVAGDVLVALEQAVEAATLAAAEADLAAASAELDRTRRGVRAEDRDAAAAEARGARARAAQSADLAARTQRLAAEGHASAEDLERTVRGAEIDAATASQAEARLRAVDHGRPEDVAAAQARRDAAQARRDEAAARLAQRTVRAPSDGEVLQVLVRPGEYQQPGGSDGLVRLGDTTALRVRVDVDERDLAALEPGDRAIVRASAFPGRDFTARVVEIGRRMGRKNVRTDDPVERNDTKILEVVLELDAAPGLLVGQRVVAYLGGGQEG